MEKIKSRWRKNYLEGDIINSDAKDDNSDAGGYSSSKSNNINYNSNHNNINHGLEHNHHHNNINSNSNNNNSNNHHHRHHHKHSVPPTYEPLLENLYLDKRRNEHSRSRKDARSMVCDCILTKEERARGVMGCLDDCLNRMLMIECGSKCTLGDHCLNKRFQKLQSAKVEVFKTRKKGWGLRTTTELPINSFIMEYVGEVVRSKEFRSRVKKYTKQKIKHHYFMALRSDEIIDATVKGNLTRFINHSCEPNCETQKWTVNGDLRIGFFTIKNLQPGDEITFDYQFQRYGRKAQKCYCEAPSCRGYIGGNEQTFSLNGNSSPQLNENKAHKKSHKHVLLDLNLEDKINTLAEDAAQGLKTKDQVIALASLSIKAEEVSDRRKLLDIIRSTKSEISLRLFVDYHGLEILCVWMRDPQADCDFKATIIDILERLPIPNKTKVLESNVYRMIERWATEEPKSQPVAQQQQVQVTGISNSVQNATNQRNRDDGEDDDDRNPQEALGSDEADENFNGRQTHPSTPTKSAQSMNTLLPVQTHTSPNIKALANKLLKKFQALSPGFKIPRLNRLQRIEIEKKMEEEVTSDDQADKLALEQKNPFARSYFKSTALNGLVGNATLKTNILPVKRKFDSLTTNNIDLTPAPKISKEEHRQQFEMHVRLKDYYDTIEKHYGAAAAEQIKLSQRAYNSINSLPLPYPPVPGQNLAYLANSITPPIPTPLLVAQSQQPSSIIPPAAAVAAVSNQTPNHHFLYPSVPLETENRYPPPIVVPPTIPPAVNSYHLTSHIQINGQQDINIAYQMNGREFSDDSYHDPYAYHREVEQECAASMSAFYDDTVETVKPEPTNMPTLIVLANNSIEPAHTIDDELAFSICDYDEYYTIRDKPLSVDDVIDDSYPYPGSYYTTPSGEIWFATVTLDRKTQQPRTVILNLQVRSEADQSQITSPYKQPSITQGLHVSNEEPVINTTTINTITTQTAITNQAPFSTDTITESPNANNTNDKLPDKIKKKMFEHGVSKFIKDALSEYYKPDSQVARITSKEDFVFLARKLTLAVLEKELNRKGCERLECNKQVKRKVEDFVRIYMAKFGKLYTRHNKA